MIARCTLVLASLLLPACNATEPPTAAGGTEPLYQQWKLPKKLYEVSGLGRRGEQVYLHDDQLGVVYEVDYTDGKLVKAFAVGRKTLQDDFEGIALTEQHVYLVNSDGTLYRFAEGQNGERVEFDQFRTGIGRRCEIEGLVYHRARQQLLLVCKQARHRDLDGTVTVFAWSLADLELLEDPYLQLPVDAIPGDGDDRRFNPSGIAIHPVSGHLYIVAARQNGLIEIDDNAQVVRRLRLPRERHRQTEGIEFLEDGRLLLADEGRGKRARLTLYESLPVATP
ncbi:MAG: SdiA-regulated domain-containing protein [Gammaproteobacteria bacterium]|nr:SdiA-regulated domain-containing protein [Gammaproteobacteria bacterium]